MSALLVSPTHRAEEWTLLQRKGCDLIRQVGPVMTAPFLWFEVHRIQADKSYRSVIPNDEVAALVCRNHPFLHTVQDGLQHELLFYQGQA